MAKIIDYPDNRLKAADPHQAGGKVFGRRTAPFPEDPVIALIAEFHRLDALAAAVSKDADKVYDQLAKTQAVTLQGILAKFEFSERDALETIRNGAIADFRCWMGARS